MRLRGSIAFLCLAFSINVYAQKSPTSVNAPPAPVLVRDPQAITVLQNSIGVMGGTPPTDSTASGTVVVASGSDTENGTVRIQTRGSNQSTEEIEIGGQINSVIYSRGAANDVINGTVQPSTLELASSSQSPDFPLPLLASLFNDPDTSLQYIGQEEVGGVAANHIRIWDSFTSRPNRTPLSDFTVKDVWINSVSGLPYMVAYSRSAHSRQGSVPLMVIEVTYSNWKTNGGCAYPLAIEKTVNGVPWTTITIQNVAFATGLTDADFPIQPWKGARP
jgi:hypothetical protein